MGITIRVGILTPEDPTDPTSRRIVTWPAFRGPEADGCSSRFTIPGQPTRALNGRGWRSWRRQRGVQAILAHCRVPADVGTGLICAPIDDQLLLLVAALHADARRWAWLSWRAPHADRAQWLLYWTRRARETFGDQARIGFS